MPDNMYITVRVASQISGYSPSHVRYLLRTDRLEGVKFGRDWLTTAEAIENYKATNPRPGRKRR